MSYLTSRQLSAVEYSHLSARLLKRAAAVLGFTLAVILALLIAI
jgi:hypothetical protein